MGSTYWIYYGWLSDGPHGQPNAHARRIAKARVPLLIAWYWTNPKTHRNLSPQVIDLMHDAGTQVYAYIATTWGDADLAAVKAEATEYMEGGVDGIFLDEAHRFVPCEKLDFYREVADLVHARGGKVIANPGVAECGAEIMDVADMIMLEHAWRHFPAASAWMSDYPAERFMGVSSNEPVRAGGPAMGYFVDADRAIADTREAWDSGIGWHTSTHQFVLPPPFWFENYVAAVAD